MADHPRIFQGPMVRAMLGDFKTETRRTISLRNCIFGGLGAGKIAREFFDHHADWKKAWPDRGFPDPDGVYRNGYLHVPAHKPKRHCQYCRDHGWEETVHRLLPRIQAGDRLWAKENWQALSFGDYLPTTQPPCDVRYEATDPLANSDKSVRGYVWRPSIHMHRWASRLTLPVLTIRIERLQAITEAAAKAEGVERWNCGHPDCMAAGGHYGPRGAYRELWDIINGSGAWDLNPWVTVTQFRVVKHNIDAPGAAAP